MQIHKDFIPDKIEKCKTVINPLLKILRLSNIR